MQQAMRPPQQQPQIVMPMNTMNPMMANPQHQAAIMQQVMMQQQMIIQQQQHMMQQQAAQAQAQKNKQTLQEPKKKSIKDIGAIDMSTVQEFKPKALTKSDAASEQKKPAELGEWPNLPWEDDNGKNPKEVYIIQSNVIKFRWLSDGPMPEEIEEQPTTKTFKTANDVNKVELGDSSILLEGL